MTIKLGEVKNKNLSDEEEIDLDWIRPDLREALDRKEASHDKNRPEAVKKGMEQDIELLEKILKIFVMKVLFLNMVRLLWLLNEEDGVKGEDLIKNTTGDGMVCGLGHVNGHLFPERNSRVMAMSYDYMVLAGTQGKMNHAKKTNV